MKRTGLIAAMSMMALVPGLAVVSAAPQALEVGPEPVSLRKRSVARPDVYRSPRGRLPHIGAKERARFAGWPDGPMHRTPHEHRAFCKGD